MLTTVFDGVRSIFDLGVAANLKAHQSLRHFGADAPQHAAKHFIGFALVFLFGLFLRIAAQVDTLAQVV